MCFFILSLLIIISFKFVLRVCLYNFIRLCRCHCCRVMNLLFSIQLLLFLLPFLFLLLWRDWRSVIWLQSLLIYISTTSIKTSRVRCVSWKIIRVWVVPSIVQNIFSHLKRLKSDIVFLQETNMRTKDQIKLGSGSIPFWLQF